LVFDHVAIRVADLEASRRFYELAGRPRAFVLVGGDGFVTQNLHVAFGTSSRDEIDSWWRRLVDAGYESDGEPGVRPQYHESYYGAFVRDPDGNSTEAVHHAQSTEGIDHLWLRTRDVAAARDFYTTIAPYAGFAMKADEPDHVRFRGDAGSFSFVNDGGPVTERVHIAFEAPDHATVDAFHAAAVAAGYRDNGGPGERPQYHEGYYGAFVLDPDGHNIEVVFDGLPRG
jgi:catechol 2,3-dioxygenase-like lactoylglutathione lyase family enzyme